MKESIVAAVIIAVLVFMCAYTTGFTSEFCDDVKSSVASCITAAEAQNWSDAEKHITDAKSKLEDKRHMLETFIMHRELDEVENVLLKIESAIKHKSAEICISEAACLVGRLERISSSDRLAIHNLF